MKPKLLVITGATGVGKTELVIKLAQRMSIEIINADIGQMYVPLTIGTAKPDWRSETTPHHFFDIIDQPVNFSIMSFRDEVEKLVNAIWERGRLPVIVGGSTFYIKSLFWLPEKNQFRDQENFEQIVDNLDNYSDKDIWSLLNKIDPYRAQQIHPNDHYRLQRALEIWRNTGRKPSEFKLQFRPISNETDLIILSRSRDDLYERINARVRIMLEMGWMKEVAGLSQAWRDFLKLKKIIGYDTVVKCLEDGSLYLTESEIEIISQSVRNYAKRQMTFWRGLCRDLNLIKNDMQGQIFELNLTSSDVDLYLNQILQKISLE